MVYAIEFSRRAERQFDKLSGEARARLKPAIDALADNPRPPGAKKLVGAEGLWRIRVGDYRIIYAIEYDRLLVLVVEVGHRREVYRRR